jgi:hypothetical protein
MDLIFTTHKGKHLDTVEKYHQYQKTEKAYRLTIEVSLIETKYLT